MSRPPLTLIVNKSVVPLPNDAWISPLDFPREDLRLYGTKKGCNEGACGARAVMVETERILSCLSLAAQYKRRTVTTTDALGDGEMVHPLQQASVDDDGLQKPLIGGRLSIGERTARPAL